MTQVTQSKISESQLRREAVEIALWETPFPKPDTAAMSKLSLDAASQEQVVGNVAVGDGSSLPDLGPLSSFKSWENVASTLLSKAETISGFDPGNPTFDPLTWSNFIHKFSTIPFFLTFTFDNRNASIAPLSLHKAVDAVTDLIQDIMTPANFDSVVTTIKKMATLAVRNKEQTEKDSHQQVGVLSRNAGQLYLGDIRATVEMQYKASKKGYEPLQQDLSVYRGYGVLDFDRCIRNASTLLKWDCLDVNAWVSSTDSYAASPNGSPAWNS